MLHHDLEELVARLIATRHFEERQSSWVSAHEELFFKIPRPDERSSILEAAANGALELAHKEFWQVAYLSEGCARVIQAMGISERFACLALRRISGRNMREVLLEAEPATRRGILTSSMRLLGELHSSTQNRLSQLPQLDYSADPYLRLTFTPSGNQSVAIDGFEVRNLMIDTEGGLWFFDPHEVSMGYAEDDVSRFIISLLMISWGHTKPVPWKAFSLPSLLAAYETSTGRTIDAEMLRYCMERNFRMRQHFARKATSRMSGGIRLVARMYEMTFFLQMKYWWHSVRLQDVN